MTVFVLCGAWDYEGECVLGAYASLAEAQVAGQAVANDYDAVGVYEIELGSAADFNRRAVWEG
jgi:hypothetical protein